MNAHGNAGTATGGSPTAPAGPPTAPELPPVPAPAVLRPSSWTAAAAPGEIVGWPDLQRAHAAASRFGISANATVTLVNVSENRTYRVDDPSDGKRYALRLHRPGYRTVAEIESEIAWVDALRAAGTVRTPAALRNDQGGHVVQLTAANGERQYAAIFEWLDGSVIDMDGGPQTLHQYETLGTIAARLHQHARGWQPPAGFTRAAWDYEHSIGPHGHWGAWQDGLGVGPQERALLSRLDATIQARLRRFGTDRERYGLVHADMRLANLLLDGSEVMLIDFDDCGPGWYMYDFATTVSFIEDHPLVPELRDAWLRGYRSVATLAADVEDELPTFVMLRRLLLLAWIGSHHSFAPEAAALGAPFTAGTCELAEQYLTTHSID